MPEKHETTIVSPLKDVFIGQFLVPGGRYLVGTRLFDFCQVCSKTPEASTPVARESIPKDSGDVLDEGRDILPFDPLPV